MNTPSLFLAGSLLVASSAALSNTCSFDIVSHRGGVAQYENSIEGAQSAFRSGFDVVEVDLMPLSDGRWVVHHDPVLGRVTRHSRGGIRLISGLTSGDWKQVSHKKGTRLYGPAPFLYQLVEQASSKSKPFNFEIKGKPSLRSLKNLDSYLQKHIGSNFQYSSLNYDVLATLRELNDSVYLGVIQAPDAKSNKAAVKKKTDKYASLKSKWGGKAAQYGVDLNALEQKATAKYGQHLVDYAKQLYKVEQLGHAGIHLDVTTLSNYPDLIKRAHRANLKVYTYDIDNAYGHRTLINNRTSDNKPDGVITDLNVNEWCSR